MQRDRVHQRAAAANVDVEYEPYVLHPPNKVALVNG
jgi:hypothetical protein